MKKFFTFFLIFLTAAAFYAKPVQIPEWVQNYRKVYPNSDFLAQRGSGDSSEKAITDATAALSRYFQTNVNANLSTTMSSVVSEDSVEEKTVVVDNVNVQSQVDFFVLEYTEPFYLKSEKKWYCVVFMNRSAAWEQYKPQIEIKKNSFNGLYKKLEKEEDYFTKLGISRNVWASGIELMEKLEYGRIINPKEEAVYQTERDKFSNIPVIIEDAKQNCSVCIKINTDYNQMISTALSKVFSDCGFRISKTEEEVNYIAEVTVNQNVAGSEPLSIEPGINVKIQNKSGKTVYSNEILAAEKSIGYSMESAQKKAYPKIVKQLEESVKNHFNSILK